MPDIGADIADLEIQQFVDKVRKQRNIRYETMVYILRELTADYELRVIAQRNIINNDTQHKI